ncbi:hypothetical protein DBY21_08395 [Candidatus Gastranaerophilales bacterium]|nr:MAG: hypothetical protein DBY21_08395 [Candidatus Gastranaerophilales bacterium]
MLVLGSYLTDPPLLGPERPTIAVVFALPGFTGQSFVCVLRWDAGHPETVVLERAMLAIIGFLVFVTG